MKIHIKPYTPKSLDERIEHFLDNDLPHLQKAVTTLNVKMWLVLSPLVAIFLVVVSPLVR